MNLFKTNGLLAVVAVAALAACGGDGGTASGPTSTGVLSDDPMAGVPYSTPSIPNGVTAADGTFQFRAGETVTFNVAGVSVAVPASDRITPAVIAQNLFPNDAAQQANAITNIAVLFQTLDADGDPNNGVIALRSGAQVQGITTANFASQCATAPSTFRNDLQTANSSNTSIRNDNTAPTAPNPDDALERFYRNELGGSWILDRFESTSGAVQRAGLDTSISLLSFDRGCTSDCTTVNDGRTLINRFVGGDYDSEESANVSADARIGRVVYVRNDSPITNDPNLGKFLIRNPNDNRQLRSNASGAAAGSTDAGEDIYNRPLVLNGDELVVQFEDGNLVYKRFANVKNSLVGTWVEDLSGENANATGAPNPTNGRHSFLREGRSIVYHFLNSSRLMLIVTDLETSNTGDEQNGVLYADYTFANGTFTITNVLANTTATTAGGGILVAGDSLPLSASSLNDTKRTLDASGQEPIDIYRLLSLTESTDESSAGFKQANAQEAVAAR